METSKLSCNRDERMMKHVRLNAVGEHLHFSKGAIKCLCYVTLKMCRNTTMLKLYKGKVVTMCYS